jgi:hypothetical protein
LLRKSRWPMQRAFICDSSLTSRGWRVATGNTFPRFLMRKTDSKELAVSIDATFD